MRGNKLAVHWCAASRFAHLLSEPHVRESAAHTPTNTTSPRRAPSVPLLDRADDGATLTQMSRPWAQSPAHGPMLSNNIHMSYVTTTTVRLGRGYSSRSISITIPITISHYSHLQTRDAFLDQYHDILPAFIETFISGDGDSTASASRPPSSLGTQLQSSAAHEHLLYPSSTSILHPLPRRAMLPLRSHKHSCGHRYPR
ncbi:hypothetical protein CONPUDRAFT_156192 [Coniophora puteana RWD-64-598 SS2]|uniref:Uncharacterized protein n=1 Tax=Coniophora puteana (strain RWD-64-598) TaxID=741705 RepID=A0A5M3MG05_CONPW|nr:uncharacterized protein CONPUDRAFT_156192 [Coniophora puteana RWD-64-598 SS2]EIW78189.1 hypothetical protein CONPUDRAFT_156192 [Coniophora puteana RWD-64-598 SS2]